MKISKTVAADLPMCYAVGWIVQNGRLFGAAASEGTAGCILFDPEHPEETVTVWDHAGGTMGIVQTQEDGTFLAVQNFFKGFRSAAACIVRAEPEPGGTWQVKKLLDLPYVHRFDVIGIEGTRFLLASTLCDAKDYTEDWSRPGRVWLGKLPEDSAGECCLKTLIPGITKNHGFYRGFHRGRPVVLISGMEGLFEIHIPDSPDGRWDYEKLLDREVSEAAVVDLDGDGEEELVTIEGFHGNQVVVNRYENGSYRPVYTYPVTFGHVVWGGIILGRPSIIIGYREDNAALILMRKRPGDGFSMEQIVLDEHQGPANISVQNTENSCKILCACGKTQQIALYELTYSDE